MDEIINLDLSHCKDGNSKLFENHSHLVFLIADTCTHTGVTVHQEPFNAEGSQSEPCFRDF